MRRKVMPHTRYCQKIDRCPHRTDGTLRSCYAWTVTRTAAHLAFVTLLAALPSLRAFCADSCGPAAAARAADPACHQRHAGPPAPGSADPVTPAGACAHGVTAPLRVRAAAAAAPDQVEPPAAPVPPFLRPAAAGRPADAHRPTSAASPAASPPNGFRSPLRC